MSFSIDRPKLFGNRHPEPFPGSELIPNLADFSPSQFKRQDVDLIVLAKSRRTDSWATETFNGPRNMQLATVRIHPAQHELLTFELNPLREDSSIESAHVNLAEIGVTIQQSF